MKPTTTVTPPPRSTAPMSLSLAFAASLVVVACSSTPPGPASSASPPPSSEPSSKPPATVAARRPVTLVPKVDLARYAGDWYVIGAIPTSFEESAFNSKESYRLEDDGRIATTFTFNEGGFTGPLKTYTSTGYILDKTSNAVWGQQYIWPIKADYRISYLSADYRQVVVTRDKRDYAWIMARTPTVSDADYQRLSAIVAREGYDAAKLRKIPQASGK